MPTKEAQEIYEQACKLVGENREDQRAQRDGAAMLIIALKRAGGPFPEAEAELAWVYFYLDDEFKSHIHAATALKADPDQFEARFLKTAWASLSLPGFFAKRQFKSELGKLVDIYQNKCKLNRSAESFLYWSGVLMHMADIGRRNGVSTRRVFSAIDSAPIDRLTFENDEQRAEVQKLRVVAQGYSKV